MPEGMQVGMPSIRTIFHRYSFFFICVLVGALIIWCVYELIIERGYENWYWVACGHGKNAQEKEIPNTLKIRLEKKSIQRVSTSIEGNIYVDLELPNEADNTVKIRFDETERYAPAEYTIKTVRSHKYGRHYGETEAVFSPSSGSEYWFPFDDLTFSRPLSIEPKTKIDSVDLYNFVRGYVIKGKPECTREDEKLRIEFTLHRKLYTKSLFIVVGGAIIFFIYLIIRSVDDPKALGISAGGFFISLWSIRGIIGRQCEVFPTLLDFFILGAAAALLIGIILKFVHKYSRSGTEKEDR